MSLSKPIFNLLGSYLSQLYNNPIRTKSIGCCVIATLGNLTAQYVSGNKSINQDQLLSYGLFGLLFGGTVPHFFYAGLDQVIPNGLVLRLLVERLLYTPFYQMLSLYMLARLEGKTHQQGCAQLLQLFWPVLKANWTYLTLIQYLNLRLVPPMLRVLVLNLVGFFWMIALAKIRSRQAQKKDNKSSEASKRFFLP